MRLCQLMPHDRLQTLGPEDARIQLGFLPAIKPCLPRMRVGTQIAANLGG
jgi:hypothetical protein